ncbi:MAG TPA: hypothetical protein VLK82_27690 [Candidatus Tectomicrobia bacterium]|nr:hypothetical protein [Candidatus Tectomicrobia bacterium]
MRPFPLINSASWARQPLSHLWKLSGHPSAYFVPPRMALVRAMTRFGRLEHRSGPLALLLTVGFDNESEQRILLRTLAIKYGGTWYHPIHFLGDRVHLWYGEDKHDIELPHRQSFIAAPYVPAAAVVERFALFRLPESWDRWPTHLRVTAKATFVHRRSRSLVVTLTNPE